MVKEQTEDLTKKSVKSVLRKIATGNRGERPASYNIWQDILDQKKK